MPSMSVPLTVYPSAKIGRFLNKDKTKRFKKK